MKTTINKSQFMDAFHKMGRDNQFSYSALDALYEYLTEYEESTQQEIELDIIAICSEFAEYESAMEAVMDYCDYNPADEDEARDYLNSRDIPFIDIPKGGMNDGIIIQTV